MQRRGSETRLRVQGQGRAYAAVVGVTVGMLTAGLAVPLAFGHTPTSSSGSASPASLTINPSSAGGGTTAPMVGSGVGPAGAAALPGGRVTATTGPGAGVHGGAGPVSTRSQVTPGSSTRTNGHPLTASDVGVTASEIKLGVVLLDIRALQPLGFSQPHFTPQEQQQQYQMFIDQVNKTGGINGRRIVPDFKTYNALDTSGSTSAGAVCRQLAEDDKVFAVVGVLGGNMDICLTQQYGIPSISNTGELIEGYQKSHNLLVTPYASFERGSANWADLTVRAGLLKGRKSGTVYTDQPVESRPEQAVVDALKADGQPVTYRAKLSNDQSTSQSQMPVEIQKMQAAGVDTVFLVTNFITALQFVQTADREGFKPQYMVSDLGSLTAEGLVQDMPASYDGAYAWTEGNPGSPENAEDKKCRVDFNAATGNTYAAGNESGGLTLFCWMVKAFTAGADATGPVLTRKGLATAFQGLSSVVLPHMLGGSFGSGKTDFGDLMRPERYATSCHCYQSAGGAERGRY